MRNSILFNSFKILTIFYWSQERLWMLKPLGLRLGRTKWCKIILNFHFEAGPKLELHTSCTHEIVWGNLPWMLYEFVSSRDLTFILQTWASVVGCQIACWIMSSILFPSLFTPLIFPIQKCYTLGSSNPDFYKQIKLYFPS